MRWFWRRNDTDRMRRPSNGELQKAREQRKTAERELNEARVAARQVNRVVVEARTLRTENQFSLRLSEAFGSRRNADDD